MEHDSLPDGVWDQNLHEIITAISVGDDSGTYPIGKLEAHERNIPHVAISIFVFCGDRLLLQRRACTKYHSGGLWANTVCSHPRWNESVEDCSQRRLREELGWTTPLQEFGRIEYTARVGALFENERVHCFGGNVTALQDQRSFNRDEVSDVRWMTLREIDRALAERASEFTEWFKIYLRDHRAIIGAFL